MALTIYGVGNLGRDPEMRVIPSGTSVANISVCFNDRYTDANGEVVKSKVWVRFTIWGKSGEVVTQYFRKGDKIFVKSATLKGDENGNPRIYQRDDGESGSSFEATLHNWEFVSSNDDNGAPASTATTASKEDDEIPF